MKDRIFILLKPLVLLLVLFCFSSSGWSEDSEAVQAETPLESKQLVSYPEQIKSLWLETFSLIQAEDLSEAAKRLNRLEVLRIKAGFSSFDGIALYFVEEGKRALDDKKLNKAAFYARMALMLAPTSPEIILRGFELAKDTRTLSASGLLLKFIRALSSSPQLLLQLLKDLSYPLLWAMSLALYLVFVVFLCTELVNLLRIVARKLPAQTRGFWAPVILLLFLTLPLLFGILWALIVWSILVYLLIPKYRWLGFIAGSIIALWGVVIPIRENLHIWLDDVALSRMLALQEGAFDVEDRAKLEALVEKRSNDPVLFYTLGQLSRKYRDFAAAERYLKKAQELFPDQPYTLAERGSVAFLAGDIAKAEKLYSKAQTEGLNTAAFLFNYSRVKFEKLEVAEAKELYREAVKKNENLTIQLTGREDKLAGEDGRVVVADIDLPILTVFKSALLPLPGSFKAQSAKARHLLSGLSIYALVVSGALLLLGFFTFKDRGAQSRMYGYYQNYRMSSVLHFVFKLIPGLAFVVLRKPVWGFLILSLFLFALMPLVAWPDSVSTFFSLIPVLQIPYALIVLLTALLLVGIGFQIKEKA